MNLHLIIYRILKIFRTKKPEQHKDDFNWDIYNCHYRGELFDLSKIYTLILRKDDYAFQNDMLFQINKDIPPLNPYHVLLYGTILRLDPGSVMELGCGGGDHLGNISVLSPKINLSGVDLSFSQLQFLKSRHPGLKAEVKQFDITLPFSDDMPEVDLAFSQSVLMHIYSGNGHLVALSNLFRISSKYVVLMENFNRHNFIEDIIKLFELKIIRWHSLFIYYRKLNFHNPNRADLLIASAYPLKFYEEFLVVEKNTKGETIKASNSRKPRISC